MTLERIATLLSMSVAEKIKEEVAANKASKEIDAKIAETEAALDALKAMRTDIRDGFEWRIDKINKVIEGYKQQIIEAWDGNKKTIKTNAGILKFRTTQSLKINDKQQLLTDLLNRATIEDIVEKYISGFNKTAVKKYMSVHRLPPDTAELIAKTTVDLKENTNEDDELKSSQKN